MSRAQKILRKDEAVAVEEIKDWNDLTNYLSQFRGKLASFLVVDGGMVVMSATGKLGANNREIVIAGKDFTYTLLPTAFKDIKPLKDNRGVRFSDGMRKLTYELTPGK